MRIKTVSADTISMDNKDNSITLTRNTNIALMGDIAIKTADQDEITAENPMRFCIYKELTKPGTYELRGAVESVIDGYTPTWTPQTFPGFYYDIDDNLGNENIQMDIIYGKLEEPSGAIYTTSTQKTDFEFEDWGIYNVIGFLGKGYFAGYSSDNLDGTSSDILDEANVTNLLHYGELTEILIDDGQEDVLDLSKALELEENYSLKVRIGTDNKGILAELQKEGSQIDKKAVLLPGTYVFVSKVGDASGVPLIAAHFQEPILLEGKSYIKVDGLWQISENPIHVSTGTSYGLMTVSNIDPISGLITMDNKDNSITLNKNKDTALMSDIRIRTADQDEITPENPLRFYIYRDFEIPADEGRI